MEIRTLQPEEQMQIQTNTDRNITGSEGLAAQANAIVESALARFSDQITVGVAYADGEVLKVGEKVEDRDNADGARSGLVRRLRRPHQGTGIAPTTRAQRRRGEP